MRVAIAVLTAAALVSGCYYRTALPGASAAPGTPVRVVLTPDASHDLAPLLGDQVHTLDARVVSSTRDTLALAVIRVVRSDDRAVAWSGERVALPRTAISLVDRRRFSAAGTALIAAGVVTAAVLVRKAVLRPPCGARPSC